MYSCGGESVQSSNKPERSILFVIAVPVSLLAAGGIQFFFRSRWNIYSDAIYGLLSSFFILSALALWIYIYLLSRHKTSKAVGTVSCLGLVLFVFLATWLTQ